LWFSAFFKRCARGGACVPVFIFRHPNGRKGTGDLLSIKNIDSETRDSKFTIFGKEYNSNPTWNAGTLAGTDRKRDLNRNAGTLAGTDRKRDLNA